MLPKQDKIQKPSAKQLLPYLPPAFIWETQDISDDIQV